MQKKYLVKEYFGKLVVREIQDLTKEVKQLEKLVTVDSILKERAKIRKKIDEIKVLTQIDIDDYEKILDEVDEQVYFMQEVFLECLKMKVLNVNTKEEATDMLKSIRYYGEIYAAEKEKVTEYLEEQDLFEEIKHLIIQKATELKAINKIAQTDEVNYKVISKIFTNKVIDLDNMSLKIEYKDEELYIYIYDENSVADKIYLGGLRPNHLEEVLQRKNKKVKIFI